MNHPLDEPFDWLFDLHPVELASDSWHRGDYLQPTTMHVVYRPSGPFTIACGNELFADLIRHFRITPKVIERLGQTTDKLGRSVYHESFLNYLQRMHLEVDIFAAPEGSVLLPEEPLLVARGPKSHIQLLESAFRLLFWECSYWATHSAMIRWNKDDLHEEETPEMPTLGSDPLSWRARAAFIGGASAEQIEDIRHLSTPFKDPDEGTLVLSHADQKPLVQIRRLYQNNVALGDIWLTAEQEEKASVSRSSCTFINERNETPVSLHFTRFKNMYQPLIINGHPIISSPHPGYFRQRTLQYLTALQSIGPEAYPYGWMS